MGRSQLIQTGGDVKSDAACWESVTTLSGSKNPYNSRVARYLFCSFQYTLILQWQPKFSRPSSRTNNNTRSTYCIFIVYLFSSWKCTKHLSLDVQHSTINNQSINLHLVSGGELSPYLLIFELSYQYISESSDIWWNSPPYVNHVYMHTPLFYYI